MLSMKFEMKFANYQITTDIPSLEVFYLFRPARLAALTRRRRAPCDTEGPEDYMIGLASFRSADYDNAQGPTALCTSYVCTT